ncbi:MAG: hypothetical protein V1792_06445 [Pseudomonadota bacterium]
MADYLGAAGQRVLVLGRAGTGAAIWSRIGVPADNGTRVLAGNANVRVGMDFNDNTLDRRSMMALITVAACMAAILVTPPFWSVYKLGIQAVFNYFKQDTFYYLAIAAKSRTGFYTFDGESATSGFHPLWQVCVTGLFNLIPDMSQESQIFSVFFVGVATVTLGLVLTGFALYNITGSRVLGILLVPGLIYLAFSFVTPFSNSPWAYMNGMESGMTVFLGGFLFTLIAVHHNNPDSCMRRKRFVIALGSVLALMVLARLDDVFLIPAFALCALLPDGRPFRSRFVSTILLVLPCALVLTGYLLFNRYSVGNFMPVSGMAKGGFTLVSNIGQLLMLSGLKPFPLSMNAYVQFFEIFYRHIQMLFPMLLAALFLIVMRKGGGGSPEATVFRAETPTDESIGTGRTKDTFLKAVLLYVLFKGLYNLLNVHVNHQGLSWYYPLSVTAVNFVALVLLSPVYRRYAPADYLTRTAAAFVLAVFLAVHVITATAVTMNVRTHGSRVFAFWKEAQKLAADLRSRHPGIKLVEFDDAFMTYSTGIPAIHGIGFALDYEGFKAKTEGRLLEYCYGRGFDTIASLQYIPLGNQDPSSSAISQHFKKSRFFGGEDLDKYVFKVLLVDEKTGATFVRFKPKTLEKG